MSSTPELTTAADARVRDDERDVWTLFAVAWASSVLFHLAGNATLAPVWGRALLGLTAVALLARPAVTWLAGALAGAVLVNVWLEAPILGNHWLLHGLVATAVLGGMLGGGSESTRLIRRIAGPIRLTLLVFYAFAAFAKLNGDFFDPAVSCAVFYLRESADSWGGLALVDALPAWGDRAVAFGVATIELSIPVLLVVRRTRNLGVLVGVTFHYVLAFDRTHQFFDFSAVLAALFLLFLDPATVGAGFERARSLRRRVETRWESGPELAGVAVVLCALATVVVAVGPADWGGPGLLREVGVVTWLGFGAVVIVGVVVAIAADAGGPRALVGPAVPAWLLLVPAVGLLNGLTPYLEVKSGTGWNMYSNLAVVDGDSNHFIVRRGFPVTDGHERLVEVIEADDGSLDFYVGSGWLLSERQLRDHLSDRPGVTVTGEIDGSPVRYEGGDGDSRPTWQQKFQVFRAVDGEGPVGCQPSFGPAR